MAGNRRESVTNSFIVTGTRQKVLTPLRNAEKLWGKQPKNMIVTVHWGGNQLESVTDSHFVVGK